MGFRIPIIDSSYKHNDAAIQKGNIYAMTQENLCLGFLTR